MFPPEQRSLGFFEVMLSGKNCFPGGNEITRSDNLFSGVCQSRFAFGSWSKDNWGQIWWGRHPWQVSGRDSSGVKAYHFPSELAESWKDLWYKQFQEFLFSYFKPFGRSWKKGLGTNCNSGCICSPQKGYLPAGLWLLNKSFARHGMLLKFSWPMTLS